MFVAKLSLIAATIATAALASPPSAAATATTTPPLPPAPPGKELIQLNCEGLGAITVSVQRGENSNGAGQIVDATGHGIPVAATLTLMDMTTGTVLATETTATGKGNAHPNQAATHCTGVLFVGSASDFVGTDLPSGVAPTDTVQLAFDGFAVIKP